MWGWLRIRWPERLTDSRCSRCPTCDHPIHQASGSDTTCYLIAYPCQHRFTVDPYTRELHPYPFRDHLTWDPRVQRAHPMTCT